MDAVRPPAIRALGPHLMPVDAHSIVSITTIQPTTTIEPAAVRVVSSVYKVRQIGDPFADGVVVAIGLPESALWNKLLAVLATEYSLVRKRFDPPRQGGAACSALNDGHRRESPHA
jgi:hypothetical protein